MGTTGRFGAETDMILCFNRTNLASILRIELKGNTDASTKVFVEATEIIQRENGGDLTQVIAVKGVSCIFWTYIS